MIMMFGAGFIVLCIFEFILLSVCFVAEKPGFATLSLIVTCAAFQWWYDIPILQTVRLNPPLAIGLIIVYVVVGVLWSFVRWWIHLHREKDRYLADVSTWRECKRLPPGDLVPDELKSEWRDSGVARKWRGKLPPLASDSKTLITSWIMYWPISIVWTLLDEPVRRLAVFAYNYVQETYTRIAASVFAGVPELPPEETAQEKDARYEKKRQEDNDRREIRRQSYDSRNE